MRAAGLDLLGNLALPIRQAKPALELNSVWAGCLVTPLVQDGQQITKLNLSVPVDVGPAGHLGGGNKHPAASVRRGACPVGVEFQVFNSPITPCPKDASVIFVKCR